MKHYEKNPLRTKKDLQDLAEAMIGSAVSNLSPEKAWLNAGESAAKYPHQTAWTEGFLRPLFGLVPLLAGGRATALTKEYLTGIRHGVDPDSPEYWGVLEGKDQKIVEMTTLGLALAMVPESIWDPLNPADRSNLASWLLLINTIPLPSNNWLFFYVIVNMGLKRVGAPYSQAVMEAALNKMEECYLGDGWYSDGPGLQRDYYVAFAIHFYSLIYARLMENEDPRRAAVYKERGAMFATDFIAWFGKEGDALPYGRSLTYRFAMAAFWSALAFAQVEVFPWGVVKGIILRNIRWWVSQPIFDERGLLTIGYRYPNLKMAEFYNAPGSPAWAMKAFLILALPDNHPFWTCEEEALPELAGTVPQKHPLMIIMRGEGGSHVQALTSGQYAGFEPSFMAAKYEKFAYSNVFGFSVQGGEYGLEQGAFDSMLALCEANDQLFRVRRACESVQITERGVKSVWKPWSDVTVTTWLIPCGNWHVRVHRIESGRDLYSGEGAYAVNCDDYGGRYGKEETKKIAKAGRAGAFYPWGSTGIIDLEGARKGETLFVHPNTNVLYSRTVIPTLTGSVGRGVTVLACAVLGAKSRERAEHDWSMAPGYERTGSRFTISYGGCVTEYQIGKD